MTSFRVFCFATVLMCLGATATAQAPLKTADTTREDIEQLVKTIENPEARARLVGELELLLEAQQDAGTGQPAKASDAAGILGMVKDAALTAWNQLTSVDPQQLLFDGMTTLGIIVGALLVRWFLLSLLRRLYVRLTVGKSATAERSDEDDNADADADADADTKKGTDLPLAVSRLLNLVTGVLVIALVAETWGTGISDILGTEAGARLAESALSVGLVLILTVALWNASEILVQRILRIGSRKLDRERTLRRLDTLVPLLTNILQTTISVFAGLLILSEIGVNIGPLLAGAGILGLAVGFGAQTLVKDLITGVTILLEDAATVGDIVEVAGHRGVVEEMRIRIIQLRDLSGIVYMIPYSEVTTVKNYSKEFSYYVLDVGVAYRENTDNVCEILNEVNDDLCDDDDFSAEIIEPLQILGVDQFADSAVIIRARIKTAPGLQWHVGREFNRRMKMRFDEEGIEIPFPHTTVYFGEPKEGSAPPMQLALTAEQQRALRGNNEKSGD